MSEKKPTTSGNRKPRPKDVNAPKQPISGYVLFLSEQRSQISQENPTLTMAEGTKLLAARWKEMTADEKQKYNQRYEESKKQYKLEMERYKKTSTYKKFQQKLKASGGDAAEDSGSEIAGADNDIAYNGTNIPIFTKEFMEHNKAREAELRRLRREVTLLEDENAALESYVQKVTAAVNALESETGHQRETSLTMRREMSKLRQKLVTAYAKLPLPGTNETPTLENIDHYMSEVHRLILENPAKMKAFMHRI